MSRRHNASKSAGTLIVTMILVCDSCKTAHVAQALAWQVSKLVVAQDQLQKVLDAKPNDEAALRQALKKATDAGLTGARSSVVRAVQKHLRQARMSVC